MDKKFIIKTSISDLIITYNYWHGLSLLPLTMEVPCFLYDVLLDMETLTLQPSRISLVICVSI